MEWPPVPKFKQQQTYPTHQLPRSETSSPFRSHQSDYNVVPPTAPNAGDTAHLHQVHTEIPCWTWLSSPASQQYFLGCLPASRALSQSLLPAYADLLWSLHCLLVVGFMEWELNLRALCMPGNHLTLSFIPGSSLPPRSVPTVFLESPSVLEPPAQTNKETLTTLIQESVAKLSQMCVFS